MTLLAWVELLTGVLKFPGEIHKLIVLLSKTPAAKRSELITALQKEADSIAQTGRPKW